MQKVAYDPERTLRSMCASMKMEGLCVSKQTQEDCRSILSGRKSPDELVNQYLRDYKKKK